MKIPAYLVLRVVSLTLIAIGLSLASLSIVILTLKGNSIIQHREIMLSLGSLLLLIGIIGPIRVVFHGVQIPAEIKHTITTQAAYLFQLSLLSSRVSWIQAIMWPWHILLWAFALSTLQ